MKQFRKFKETSGFSFKIYLLLTFLIDMTLSSNTSKVGLFLRVFTYSRVGRFKVWFVQLREYGRRRRVLFGLNNSSFSTYAKFSEKLNISNVRVHIRGLEILLFRKMLLARIKWMILINWKWFQTMLIDFSSVSHFCTPWKCQKTKDFLTFSGGYRNVTLD